MSDAFKFGDTYGREYTRIRRNLFQTSPPAAADDHPQEGFRAWITELERMPVLFIAAYDPKLGYQGQQAGLLFYADGRLSLNPNGWHSAVVVPRLQSFLPKEVRVTWQSTLRMTLTVLDEKLVGLVPENARRRDSLPHTELWALIPTQLLVRNESFD